MYFCGSAGKTARLSAMLFGYEGILFTWQSEVKTIQGPEGDR
jgi:hypothetical protein